MNIFHFLIAASTAFFFVLTEAQVTTKQPTVTPTPRQTTLKLTTGCTCGCTCSPPTTTTISTSRKPSESTTSKTTTKYFAPTMPPSTKATTRSTPRTDATSTATTSSTTTKSTSTTTVTPVSTSSRTSRPTTPSPSATCPARILILLYCDIATCDLPFENTLCQYSPSIWGVACQPAYPAASIVSDSDIEVILDIHNYFRRRVAKGGGYVIDPNEETPPPPPNRVQPPASNMRQMYWDNELACMAATWVHQCLSQHDQCRDVGRFKVGQNIFIATSTSDTLGTSDWPMAPLLNWYNEIGYMNLYPNDNNVISFPNPSTLANPIDRYTQIVWADTYLVGCATAYYRSTNMFGGKFVGLPPGPPVEQKSYYRLYVCNYGPTGNIIGSPIYSIGHAGSACPTGTVNNNGLCALQ